MTQTRVMLPLRNKPFGGAWSINDKESIDHLSNIQAEKGDRQLFLNDYRDWIAEKKNFIGYAEYKHLDFCAGTTEAFGLFYYKHIDKRLRLLKGEYFYHWMMARNYFRNSAELGSEPIKPGDVVVMSCPFSGTGNLPPGFYDILKQCDEHNVPVMLDMAYIGISNMTQLDLSYKCIESITSSLSKVFPVENYRIGIRLQRKEYDDTLFAYNENNYVNLYSIHVGHQFIKKFSNNWIYEKYKDKQIAMCEDLKVNKSDCVIFGLADKGQYDEYHRGGAVNRLCFSRIWDKRALLD